MNVADLTVISQWKESLPKYMYIDICICIKNVYECICSRFHGDFTVQRVSSEIYVNRHIHAQKYI